MSNSDVRVRFTDYLRRHHPKLVQEFSTTRLPPDELGLWGAFKLVVELDKDGFIVGSADISFVDDRDPDEAGGGSGVRAVWESMVEFMRAAGNRPLVFAVLVSILGGVYYAIERFVVADSDSALTVVGGAGGIAVLYVVGFLTRQNSFHARNWRHAKSAEGINAFSGRRQEKRTDL